MKIALIDLIKGPYPSVGLAYLAGTLKKTNHPFFVIDCFLKKNTVQYVIDNIKRQAPDVVGFSALPPYYDEACRVAQAIKTYDPQIQIIFGGIHTSLIREKILLKPEVDAICIGEGEQTLVEYLDALEKKRDLNIPGLWYKKGTAIVRNPMRKLIENLDDIPFPEWDYWDMELYFKVGTSGTLLVVASRGCPFSCAFCFQKPFRNFVWNKEETTGYYRSRSSKNIIDEIKYQYKKYTDIGLKTIQFADDIFDYNQQLFIFFSDYIKAGLNKKLPWSCSILPGFSNEKWVSSAKKAGCFWIEMGLENSDEKIRMDKFNKLVTDAQFRKTTSLLRKYGIQYTFNLIIGAYGETPRDIINNIKNARKLRPLLLHPTPYMPFPETDLYREHGEKNLKMTDKLGGMPRIETDLLSIKQLDRIVWKIKINQIIRKFGIGLKLEGLQFIIKNAESIIYFTKYAVYYKNVKIIKFLHNMLDRRIYEHYRDKFVAES